MSSSNGPESDHDTDVIGSMLRKGIQLWSENGALRFKAPKGVLTREDLGKLKKYREQILASLDTDWTGKDCGGSEALSRYRRAPLAFSQLALWNAYQSGERRPCRQIASATRVQGVLHLEALKKSIDAMFQRHDALRTGIEILDGIPVQTIADSAMIDPWVADLTEFSPHVRESNVIRLIVGQILEPVDVTASPLFNVGLIKCADNHHVLVLTLDHMISDMFSMGILLRDLFATYVQTVRGEPSKLPELPLQFADYAIWQRGSHAAWMDKHGAYWREFAAQCGRVRFLPDGGAHKPVGSGWGTVSLEIDRCLKTELSEWCKVKKTTLVMAVFTVFVALVLRWCDTSQGVVQYQSDGRASTKTKHTIGFFAASLYINAKLHHHDSFLDLLDHLTFEYCNAHEHVDGFYWEAQTPRPGFTHNAAFNWVPSGSNLDLSGLEGFTDAIVCSPVRFGNPTLKYSHVDGEPVMLLFETTDSIVGGLHFPLDRFSISTMERFCRNFTALLKELLRNPEGRVQNIKLS